MPDPNPGHAFPSSLNNQKNIDIAADLDGKLEEKYRTSHQLLTCITAGCPYAIGGARGAHQPDMQPKWVLNIYVGYEKGLA